MKLMMVTEGTEWRYSGLALPIVEITTGQRLAVFDDDNDDDDGMTKHRITCVNTLYKTE